MNLSRRIAVYSWLVVLLATNLATGTVSFFLSYNHGWTDAAHATEDMQVRRLLIEKAQRELPPHRLP